MSGRIRPGTQTVRDILVRVTALQATMMLVISLAAMATVYLAHQDMADYGTAIVGMVDAEEDLHLAVSAAQASLQDYVLDPNESDRATFLTQSAEAQKVIVRVIDEPDGLISAETETNLVVAMAAWLHAAQSTLIDVDAGSRASLTAVKAAYARLSAALDTLRADVLDLRSERSDAVLTRMQVALWAVFAAAVIFIVLILYLNRWSAGLLARPLTDLAQVVRLHQRGDRTVRANTDSGATEVVAVAAAFNQLADTQTALETDRQQVLDYYRLQARVAGALTADHGADSFVGAVQALGEGMGADRALLHLVDGGRLVARASWSRAGNDRHLAGLEIVEFPRSGDATRLRRQARVLTAGGAVQLAWLPSPFIEAFEAEGWRSAVVLTITVGHDLLGVLCLVMLADRSWDPGEMRAIERCGDYIAQAIAEERLVDSLREVETQQADFLATTSHELRTPLTSISGYLEMFTDGDLGAISEEQVSACAVMDRNVVRLRSLIDDLLIMNRLSVTQPNLRHIVFDLGERVTRTVESLEVVARRAGVNLSLERCDHVQVAGDADQIERAIVNVVSNAVKFTPLDGTVTVTCEAVGDEGVITCSDTGIGIPTGDLPTIFERFARASNARHQQVPGTGLGLPIVKAIIEAHGGRVTATSQQDRGSTFIIRVPRVVQQEVDIRLNA